MLKKVLCPYCKGDSLKLISEKLQKYKCNLCSQEFSVGRRLKIPREKKILDNIFKILSKKDNSMFFNRYKYEVSKIDKDESECNYKESLFQLNVQNTKISKFIKSLFYENFSKILVFRMIEKSPGQSSELECIRLTKDEIFREALKSIRKDKVKVEKQKIKIFDETKLYLFLTVKQVETLVSTHFLEFSKQYQNKNRRLLNLSESNKKDHNIDNKYFILGSTISLSSLRNNNCGEEGYIIVTDIKALEKQLGEMELYRNGKPSDEQKDTIVNYNPQIHVWNDSSIDIVIKNKKHSTIKIKDKLSYFDLVQHIYPFSNYGDEDDLIEKYNKMAHLKFKNKENDDVYLKLDKDDTYYELINSVDNNEKLEAKIQEIMNDEKKKDSFLSFVRKPFGLNNSPVKDIEKFIIKNDPSMSLNHLLLLLKNSKD